MSANADPIATLADPTRRAIFERLADGPQAVGALAAHFPVSRPAVSQHLRILKQAGLVRARQSGTRRLYAVDPRGVEQLRAYFEDFWTRSLRAFAQVAEQADEEEEET